MKFLTIGAFLMGMFSYAQDSLQISFSAVDLSPSDSVELNVFKGYISNVEITFNDGQIYREPNSYHLLNFLDSAHNSIQLPNVNASGIASLSYAIGTDSSVNVNGAYDGDLDPILGMYWAWNSGYINFKLEGQKSGKEFTYHIGGYAHPYATAKYVTHPISTETTHIFIAIDLSALFTELDPTLPSKIMSPGSNAVTVANAFSKVFSVHE